jgi:hypothetical protein
MFLMIALATASPQRKMKVTVEVPVAEPDSRSLYRSSTETYRMRNGRVLGPFQSTHDNLSCELDGRWLTARVEYSGADFPEAFPQKMVCQNDDLYVDVTVIQAPPIEDALVDGRVVLERSWGQVAKTSVVVPVDGLAEGRVPADVRGVTCDVDTHGETTLSVRVSGPVFKDEATCVLPTEEGGSYAVEVELPRGS